MPRIMWVGLFIGLASAASADQTNLRGGVYILHHPPEIVYTDPAPEGGWCQHYLDNHAISDLADQNPRIDSSAGSVWYVLGAFVGDAEWCGAEFGFGSYNGDLFGFTQYGPCLPGLGLELPTENWPGPNSGTAIVTSDTNWQGTLVPVYYFAGFAYGEGLIPLAADPATDFIGFGNCSMPPEIFSVRCVPAMGLFTDGIACYPSTPPPAFVCCVGETCYVISEEECEALQGEFHPEWEDCGPPNPCLPTPSENRTWGSIKALYR